MPLDHDTGRLTLLSILGADFEGVPVYNPGARVEETNLEEILVHIPRDALGLGPGATIVYDIYVRVDPSATGQADRRATVICKALFAKVNRRIWGAGDDAIFTTAEITGPPQDLAGRIRRQVVVKARTPDEMLNLVP